MHVAQILGEPEYDVVGRLFGDGEVVFGAVTLRLCDSSLLDRGSLRILGTLGIDGSISSIGTLAKAGFTDS